MTKKDGWFREVKDSVVIPDNITWGGSRVVDDDETIFAIKVEDFLDRLRTEVEFYDNPTPDMMQIVAEDFLNREIHRLRSDATHYIKHALPLFLADVFETEEPKEE